MRIYIDRQAMREFHDFWDIIHPKKQDIRKNIEWIFGFAYESKNYRTWEYEWHNCDTNIFKLLMAPLKAILLILIFLIVLVVYLICLPFAAIVNLKIALDRGGFSEEDS